jgi:hypothetical protein
VIVVYTSHSYCTTRSTGRAKTMKCDKKRSDSVERLERASITVIRVRYNHQLPPVCFRN